jgi:hypothetical protein
MIHYFYHMDYLSKKPLSRRSSQRSSNRPTSLRSRQPPPSKLILDPTEDPLLALVAAAMPLTPPPSEPTFPNVDAFAKMPATPMADQFLQDDDLESVHSEPESDIESSHLITHAKVYAIAEKYVPLCSEFYLPFFFFFFFFSLYPSPCLAGWLPSASAELVPVMPCIARRLQMPTNPAICVTSMSTTPINAFHLSPPCHHPHHAHLFVFFSVYGHDMGQ